MTSEDIKHQLIIIIKKKEKEKKKKKKKKKKMKQSCPLALRNEIPYDTKNTQEKN